jgi:hypothetical protein
LAEGLERLQTGCGWNVCFCRRKEGPLTTEEVRRLCGVVQPVKPSVQPLNRRERRLLPRRS